MENKFYELLLQKLGLDHDKNMRPHSDRSLWDYQRQQFTTLFKARSRAEWCDLLEGTDTCFAPVLTMEEAGEHPHLKARQTYIDLHGVNQPGPNPRFSATAPESTIAPSALGQHSIDVLTEIGMSAPLIDELSRSGIVFQAPPIGVTDTSS